MRALLILSAVIFLSACAAVKKSTNQTTRKVDSLVHIKDSSVIITYTHTNDTVKLPADTLSGTILVPAFVDSSLHEYFEDENQRLSIIYNAKKRTITAEAVQKEKSLPVKKDIIQVERRNVSTDKKASEVTTDTNTSIDKKPQTDEVTRLIQNIIALLVLCVITYFAIIFFGKTKS